MTAIIAALIVLGLIGSPQEYNDLSEQEKKEYTEIIIMDDVHM